MFSLLLLMKTGFEISAVVTNLNSGCSGQEILGFGNFSLQTTYSESAATSMTNGPEKVLSVVKLWKV